MNNLYNPSDVAAIVTRIEQLTPEATRQWGKMTVTQMLSHCTISMDLARGKHVVRRVFLGRIIGTLIKKAVLNEKPFKKNSPTDKSFIFKDERNFDEEKAKAIASLNAFFADGPSACTTHPHPFFGSYTPEQWAILQWKHFDHHLRQFGA